MEINISNWKLFANSGNCHFCRIYFEIIWKRLNSLRNSGSCRMFLSPNLHTNSDNFYIIYSKFISISPNLHSYKRTQKTNLFQLAQEPERRPPPPLYSSIWHWHWIIVVLQILRPNVRDFQVADDARTADKWVKQALVMRHVLADRDYVHSVFGSEAN